MNKQVPKKHNPDPAEIIRSMGLKGIVATVSAFAIWQTLAFFVNLQYSFYQAELGTLVVLAALGGIYNALCQARGYDLKNALIEYWYKMSYTKHVLVIFFCLAFFLSKLFIFLKNMWSENQNYPNIKLLANDLETTN